MVLDTTSRTATYQGTTDSANFRAPSKMGIIDELVAGTHGIRMTPSAFPCAPITFDMSRRVQFVGRRLYPLGGTRAFDENNE